MKDLKVSLGAVTLDNPVIPASGTCGFGKELSNWYDLDILGSLSFKGTTIAPRDGNAAPRVAECPAGMLNSVGLQNPGAHHAAEWELKELKKLFHKPLIANISGFSERDYVEAVEVLQQDSAVAILEINISCPNVHGGGMSFGTDPSAAAGVTRAVKAVTTKPVIVKLSPNVTDITEIAKACEDAGADGISLINTLLGMRIDLKTRRPILANTTGGLSCPAVFPVALRMVYQVAKAVSVPVVGMGGVSSAEDVLEMMMAGAAAVEVGAANLVDPFACKKIIEALPAVMDKYGIGTLKELKG